MRFARCPLRVVVDGRSHSGLTQEDIQEQGLNRIELARVLFWFCSLIGWNPGGVTSTAWMAEGYFLNTFMYSAFIKMFKCDGCLRPIHFFYHSCPKLLPGSITICLSFKY